MAAHLFLGLDTATPYLSLALWSRDAGELGRLTIRVERDHAERILAELDTLFDTIGHDKRDLAGIGVGLGPGSYTGLRVGIATAKGLARGLGVPLVGRGTLEAIANGALSEGETGVAALDARRGQVYAAVFARTGTGIETIKAPFKGEREALKDTYKEISYTEDTAPDAAYLARACAEGFGSEVVPLYL